MGVALTSQPGLTLEKAFYTFVGHELEQWEKVYAAKAAEDALYGRRRVVGSYWDRYEEQDRVSGEKSDAARRKLKEASQGLILNGSSPVYRALSEIGQKVSSLRAVAREEWDKQLLSGSLLVIGVWANDPVGPRVIIPSDRFGPPFQAPGVLWEANTLDFGDMKLTGCSVFRREEMDLSLERNSASASDVSLDQAIRLQCQKMPREIVDAIRKRVRGSIGRGEAWLLDQPEVTKAGKPTSVAPTFAKVRHGNDDWWR